VSRFRSGLSAGKPTPPTRLDRHLREHGDKLALIFEAEDGRVENWTYKQLHREVCRFANALLSIGAKPGSPITIYLPMVPKRLLQCSACARIGAPHSVIFAGFAATAIRDRVFRRIERILSSHPMSPTAEAPNWIY
jgi:acyl-coenzyme A synthetase/AMP-(fatty) acid ligase